MGADPAAIAAAVTRYLAVVDDAIQNRGGVNIKMVGDTAQAAFPTPLQAIAAVITNRAPDCATRARWRICDLRRRAA